MRSHSCVRVLLLLCLAFLQKGYTQDSSPNRIISLPDKLLVAVDQKTISINRKLDKQTQKYLSRLQKQETRLKKKLLQKDSLLATQLFQQVDDQYTSLKSVPQNVGKFSSVYSGHLDSLSTVLNFLKDNQVVDIANKAQVEKTLQQLQGLQGRFNQSDQISKYLEERQQLLKEQFQKLGNIKALKKFNKQVYYYRIQVNEYKQVFEDPNKLEAKLMEIVMKVPQFKDFFARNSQLGSLFALPTSDGSTSVAPQGLQTRAMLNEQLAQRFGSGAEVTKMLQQNVQAAQGQLSALKDKANQYSSGAYGNTSSDIEQPDFKPRTLRTKNFFKRLEYGGNLQTQKARSYFPITSDIAATLGYKLGDKSIIGVGISYRVGLGHGWNDIKLTHQGVGLRSYLDMKLKGGIYVSGGYEQNYRSAFTTISQLKEYSAWQTSCLVGLIKKYSISKKMKGNVQLLWDFLSYQQIPKTQPIFIRVGYNFK